MCAFFLRAARQIVLYIEGDSIAQSPYPPAVTPLSYGRLLAARLANFGVEMEMFAFPGTNMTDMEQRLVPGSGGVDERFDMLAHIAANIALGKRCIVLEHMGNALVELTTTNAYIRKRAYWATIRAAGAEIGTADVLHRNNAVNAPGFGDGVAVNAHNALIQSDPAAYDFRIPFSQNFIGTLAACGDEGVWTIYMTDGIHPSTIGYNLPYCEQETITTFNAYLNPQRPANTVLPSISGTPVKDSTLTAAQGIWSRGTLTRQWYRLTSGSYPVAISAATGGTYVPTVNDIDKTIKVNETATWEGFSWTKESAYTATITASYGPELNTADPTMASIAGYTATGLTSIASVGGKCVATGNGTLHGRFNPTVDAPSEIGSYYRVTVDFELGVNSRAGRVLIQSTFGGTTLGTIDCATTGSYAVVVQATTTTLYVDLRDPSDLGAAPSGTTWKWDNLSIKKVL